MEFFFPLPPFFFHTTFVNLKSISSFYQLSNFFCLMGDERNLCEIQGAYFDVYGCEYK
jgi:hypothetical protein